MVNGFSIAHTQPPDGQVLAGRPAPAVGLSSTAAKREERHED